MKYLNAARSAFRAARIGVLIAFAVAALYATAESAPPVVNINTATEAQYMLLPGIGPKIASELNDLAEANDHRDGMTFKTIDDLLEVKGIGPKKLEALRPYVTLIGPTTAVAKIHVRAGK